MTRTSCLVVAAFLLSASGCATTADKPEPLTKTPTVESELARMQGAWRAEITAHDEPATQGTFTFDRDSIEIAPSQEEIGRRVKATVQLDPAQPVRAITLVINQEADAAIVTVRGRYTWREDGGLTLCFPKDEDDPAPSVALPCDAPQLIRMQLTRAAP